MTALFRLIASIILVAVAGFSCFGFLVSSEVVDPLPWKIGLIVLSCVCLVGAPLTWEHKR